MARVLFTSCPAYGHLLPMLPLIRAAERAGHDVRVATGPDLLGQLAARGLDGRAVGRTFQEAWSAHETVWADPDLPDDQKMMDGVVALFGWPALGRLNDLVVMAQEWRPDIIVHEVLEAAASLLARRLGVPGVVHGFGPMFPFYAEFLGPAGAVIGEPDLWAQASCERALDICPPSLQPEGPPPWPDATPLRVGHDAGRPGARRTPGAPPARHRPAAERRPAGPGRRRPGRDSGGLRRRHDPGRGQGVTGDPAFRIAAERVRDEIAAMPDAHAVWASVSF